MGAWAAKIILCSLPSMKWLSRLASNSSLVFPGLGLIDEPGVSARATFMMKYINHSSSKKKHFAAFHQLLFSQMLIQYLLSRPLSITFPPRLTLTLTPHVALPSLSQTFFSAIYFSPSVRFPMSFLTLSFTHSIFFSCSSTCGLPSFVPYASYYSKMTMLRKGLWCKNHNWLPDSIFLSYL